MEPNHPDGQRAIHGLPLRRAVLGVLLTAGGPLSIGDIERRLRAHGLRPFDTSQRTSRRSLADLLRYQSTIGHVHHVERGVYEAVPSAMSRSMRDRCRRMLRSAAL